MDALLAAARFVHYAAALQLFGVAMFQSLLAPAGLREALDRPARITSIVSALLLLVSGGVWLSATAGSMGDGWTDTINIGVIGTILTATEFGRVWGPHLFFAVVLVGLATMSGIWMWRLVLVISAIALGTLGLIGHAVIESGVIGLLNETSQTLHILSSGFWLGALLPLLFCLKKFGDPAHEAAADMALRRFSGLGHLAVAILMLSGVANTWFILSATHIDLTAPYQRLLLVKIGIAGAMALLAIVNRYVFVPNIPNHGPGARQLAHGTIAEIVLGTGILGLVSVIGMLSPA